MRFFEAQDDARRATTRLIVLFILAVITLIGLADLLVVTLLYVNAGDTGIDFPAFATGLDINIHLSIILVVVLVVLVGAFYKTAQLRAGGHVVAESMGGQAVPQNTDDPLLRRLLNVVEEMAIAAGVPVPRVYVLRHEYGINAFAAGTTTDDAIICVTQGTLETLERDKLQGVIAHEFSHILNGDMRLNGNITGILHGILLLGLLGLRLLRLLSYRRGRASIKGNSVAGLAMLGGGLVVIGFGGTFFGNIIKATVNRQREYLADASAVQFTRNPDGIAGALKAIGGYSHGSVINSPAAPEVSHFFFAAGVSSLVSTLFSTHPPLARRIRRIDPSWDGSFPMVVPLVIHKGRTEELVDGESEAKEQRRRATATVLAAGVIEHLSSSSNLFTEQKMVGAYSLLAGIGEALKSAARDPFSARALIYTLLLNQQKDVRQQQLDLISERAEEGVYGHISTIYRQLKLQPREIHLPLVEMAIPALRTLSTPQVERFKRVMTALIQIDRHVSVFEWVLQVIVNNALVDDMRKPATGVMFRQLETLTVQVRVILSMLAYTAAASDSEARQSFGLAAERLGLDPNGIYQRTDLRFSTVDNGLKQLDRLAPLEKKRFLEACVTAVGANNHINVNEFEVLRAIAASLHCPMAPLTGNPEADIENTVGSIKSA